MADPCRPPARRGRADHAGLTVGPQIVVERANRYDVGTETIGSPRIPETGNCFNSWPAPPEPCSAARRRVRSTRPRDTARTGVKFLNWLWLDPDDHPRWWAFALIVIGLLGLSVPVGLAVDGAWNGVVAGTAGLIGFVLLAGIALLAGARLGATPASWRPAGMTLSIVALAAAAAIAWFGGMVAAAVTAAVVAAPILLAGATIAALIICRPKLFKPNRD